MTIPTSGAPVAAWYTDPQDATQLRWWDGSQWTSHTSAVPQPEAQATPAAFASGVSAPAAAPSYSQQYAAPLLYGTSPRDARVPESTPKTNWIIWVFVFIPLLSVASIFSWDFTAYMQEALTNPYASSAMLLDPGYLLISLGSWVLYGAMVVLAYFDWRWLGQQGYPRRFHWAWTFLNSLVYVIGRSVVVKRQAGSGTAPMWVSILLTVVSFIAIIVWTFTLMAAMVTMIEQVPGVAS